MAAFGQMANRAEDSNNGARKNPFLKLEAGKDVTIRILDRESTDFFSYYLMVNANGKKQGVSIIAGRNNPIKSFYAAQGLEEPKARRRARINVLDRTPDDKGVPLNVVKIFEYGSKVDSDLGALHGRARSRANPSVRLQVWDVDLLLVTDGQGLEKRTNIMVSLDEDPLSPELASLPRYDLHRLCEPLPNEAVQRILEGEDYYEILTEIGRNGDWPMVNPTI